MKKTWLSLNSDHIPKFRDSAAAAGKRSWLSVSLPAPALVTYGVLVRLGLCLMNVYGILDSMGLCIRDGRDGIGLMGLCMRDVCDGIGPAKEIFLE
jgi:hypothetical protein